MEAEIVKYFFSHPGQITSGAVLVIFWILGKMFLNRLEEMRVKHEAILEAITKRVEVSESEIKDNRHLLTGVRGDNGIVSKVRNHTERLNKHSEQIAQNMQEISILKTKFPQ